LNKFAVISAPAQDFHHAGNVAPLRLVVLRRARASRARFVLPPVCQRAFKQGERGFVSSQQLNSDGDRLPDLRDQRSLLRHDLPASINTALGFGNEVHGVFPDLTRHYITASDPRQAAGPTRANLKEAMTGTASTDRKRKAAKGNARNRL
jgi:hypothetical protein